MARPSRASAPSTRIIGFRLTEEEERQLDELVVQRRHKDRSALLRSWLDQKPEPSGIRFTADEERRLDELVAEQGYENRATLLRAWLDEKKPVPDAILARCAPSAQTLFSFVLDEAKRRAFRVTWKSRGFWLDARNFLWSMNCNEPNLVGFDFRENAQAIRLEELATGLWDWYRLGSLRLSITESNVERVRERIVRIFDAGMPKATKTEPKESSFDMRHVYDALRRRQNPQGGLMYVPDVARAVEHLVPLERVHAVLRELVERGVLELHPNAGREALPDEDAALCPMGPMKTVFVVAKWKG